MAFTVLPLHDNEFLVSGTDSTGTDGKTVLVSESWAAYLYLQKHELVMGAFNDVVANHFKDITDAAEAARTALEEDDDYSVITVSQGSEGAPEEHLHLDKAGRTLNMIAKGKGDKLIWVGDRLVAVK